MQFSDYDLIADPSIRMDFLPYHLRAYDNKKELEEKKIVLHYAIERMLDPGEQALIQCIYQEGCSQKEVALRYGISNSTVSRRLKTIEKKLKEQVLFFEQAQQALHQKSEETFWA